MSAHVDTNGYTQAVALASHRARAIQISHRSHTSTITDHSAASAAWHPAVPTGSHGTASVASTPLSTPRSAMTPRDQAGSTAAGNRCDSKGLSKAEDGQVQAVTDDAQAAEPAPVGEWPAGLDPLDMLHSKAEVLSAVDGEDGAEKAAEQWPAGLDMLGMLSGTEAEAQTAAVATDQAEEPAGIWPAGLDPMDMLGTAEVEAVAEEAGAADSGHAIAEAAADSVGENGPTDGNTEDGPTDGSELDRSDVPSHTPMFSWLRNLFGRHRPATATTDGKAVVPPESSVQIAPADVETELPSAEGDTGLPHTPVATSTAGALQLTPPEVAMPPELGDAVGEAEQVLMMATTRRDPAGSTAAGDRRDSRVLLTSQLLETQQQLERSEAERQRLLMLLEQQGLHNADAMARTEEAAGIGEQLPPMLTREVPEREMPWSVTRTSRRTPPTDTQASPDNLDEFGPGFGGHSLMFAGLGAAADSPVLALNQLTPAAPARDSPDGAPATDDESVNDEALLLPD